MTRFLFRLRWALLAVCILQGVLLAENVVETVQADGYASDQDTSVANALTEAVRQVTGAYLESSRITAEDVRQASSVANGDVTRQTILKQEVTRRLQLKTKGTVQGYRVEWQRQEANGQWHTRLAVQVARYISPGLPTGTRRKIVMMPFSTQYSITTVGQAKIKSAKVAEDLLGVFNMHFTQSRRFTVLSRQDCAAMALEKKLISAASPVEEMAKLGQTLGLDYMVAGTIKELYIAPTQTSVIPVSGTRVSSVSRAFLELDYRILVVATSQIKWADVIRVDLTPQQIAQCGGDHATLYSTLIDGAVRGMAKALDNIYPLRVLQVLSNGECVLDQGGSLMVPGMVYEAMLLGDELRSPVNGEPLGRAEQHLCFLQITRVDAKLSYAMVLRGTGTMDAAAVAQGIIVRPYRGGLSTGGQPVAPAAPPVIKLPYDK